MAWVGVLLMAGIGVIAVEAVGYSRGGYNAEFWKLPLDDKLNRIAVHRWEWWWIAVWELVGLFLMTGGLAGLTYLLAAEGAGVAASVAFGGYLVALFAWVFGLVTQAAAGSQAASQRIESGETPAWVHPFWDAAYLAEAAWIIGANLAFALIGVAVLQSGLVGAWGGWAALGVGIVIPVVVLSTRIGFPQLGVIVPFILGVAVIIETF